MKPWPRTNRETGVGLSLDKRDRDHTATTPVNREPGLPRDKTKSGEEE